MIIEGLNVEDIPASITGIMKGELYFARRNGNWKLLECKEVKDGCVYPTTIDYPFDLSECYKTM